MKITTNLSLKKPEGTDIVNIDDINYNADVMDAEIGNIKKGVVKVGASGSSDTAAKLQTPRVISLNGDVIGNANFDGSANTCINARLQNSGVTAGSYTKVSVDEKGRVVAGSNPMTLAGYGITDALPTSSYTAADVLNKLKTVHGEGSGLNADLLDGKDSTAFATAAQGTKADTALQASQLDKPGGVTSYDVFKSHLAENAKQIGDINDATLDVTLKGKSLTEMTKILFQSANNSLQQVNSGKDSIYNAVVGKGVTPKSKDFRDLTAGINSIVRGQGNSIESDVISGKTFTGDDGIKRTGSIPVNPGLIPNSGNHIQAADYVVGAYDNDGMRIYLRPGIAKIRQILDGDIWITKQEPDLFQENILSGKTILGIKGTGLKFASGNLNPAFYADITISGFGFTPKMVIYEIGPIIGFYYPDLNIDMTTMTETSYGNGSLKACSYNTVTLKRQVTSEYYKNVKWFIAGN